MVRLIKSPAPEPSAPAVPPRLDLHGGAPVPLPEGAAAWTVSKGRVEAYLVWSSGRRLLAVVEEGGQVFGLAPGSGAGVHLVTPEPARLVSGATQPLAVDHWITGIAEALGGDVPEADQPDQDTGAYSAGAILSVRSGVLWAVPSAGVSLDPYGTGGLHNAPGQVALSGSLWARVLAAGVVDLVATDALAPESLADAVAEVTASLTALYDVRGAADEDAALARMRLDDTSARPTAQLPEAITRIASALGLKPADLPQLPAESAGLPIPAFCRVAGMRARKIVLEEGWQTRDHGPLLLRDENQSVHGLVWDGRAYRDGTGKRVDGARVSDFRHTAFTVSAPLPARVRGLWSLAFHVMRQGNRRDALATAAAGACVAGLGILTPMATAWLLSDIVPAGIAGLLFGVGIALACAALISTVLGVARSLATTRIEGRGATALGAALTDRLLRLPARFFKDFSAGDLNQRIENVEAMRQLGVSIVMSAGLTAVMSVAYLGVLFLYDLRLALMGVSLVAVYIVAVIIARVLQMEAIREAATLDGEIAGLTYETLDGVGKLRAAAAEERAMARWLDVYRRERAAGVRAGRVGVGFGAFADAYQTITLMVLFAGAAALAAVEAPAGIFIGFLAAFGSFQGAFVGLSQALLQVYSAQPLVERAKPILEAETEVDPGRGDPGRLRGEIESSGLAFSYEQGLPPILNGLDFHVRPGEHMAIVGGSGSGKSTLLRLLLGFETPQRGAILYDGQDLTRLDLTRVRSQIGVVLQVSQLFAGSILENIRGAGNASLEACLDAADKAGLSQDLQYFAMGLHTPITEGAGTLSGGQRQRILIARALAANPNILFFDEATSALDNATQAIVSQTLDGLRVTRITIAHRLSTVRYADRICVLKEGKFIEQGTFGELMALKGVFADLARRQLTEE